MYFGADLDIRDGVTPALYRSVFKNKQNVNI